MDTGPASRTDDAEAEAEDELNYQNDDVEHAAWLSGIGAAGDADDDDEYCDTADDLRATPRGARPVQAGPSGEDAADRASRSGAGGRADTADGAAGPDQAPAAGANPADTGVVGWPSSAGLRHAPRPPAREPRDDGPPGTGAPADGQPAPGPFPGQADRPRPTGPDDSAPDAPGRPGAEGMDGPTAAADVPADLASRTGLTDTMAAELAGWAAGELPGQASARLAAWASVGGAVARGRRQARGGGSTAAERVR